MDTADEQHERVLKRLERLGPVQRQLEHAIGVSPSMEKARALHCLIKGLVFVCAARDLESAQLNGWTCLRLAWLEAGLPPDGFDILRDELLRT